MNEIENAIQRILAATSGTPKEDLATRWGPAMTLPARQALRRIFETEASWLELTVREIEENHKEDPHGADLRIFLNDTYARAAQMGLLNSGDTRRAIVDGLHKIFEERLK